MIFNATFYALFTSDIFSLHTRYISTQVYINYILFVSLINLTDMFLDREKKPYKLHSEVALSG